MQINIIFLGDEDRTYYVDLTGDGIASKGKPTTKPDATLTMEADKLEELFDGQFKLQINKSIIKDFRFILCLNIFHLTNSNPLSMYRY